MARKQKPQQTIEFFSSPEKSALRRLEQQERTRSKISLIFIIAYLLIIFILIIFTTFFALKAESAKDYLLAIGSPLGFIIGYYFKSGGKD